MTHSTRYQGAIIRDHHILLLKQVEHANGRSYWQIPGKRAGRKSRRKAEMRERMGTVFVDMVMSLDGFVAGPNNDDSGLHDWYFAPSGHAVDVIAELLHSIGAMIIGKRSFGDQPDGFDTPYKVPHFVLTHTPRQTVRNGDVPFLFVADGIASALAQAQAAAGRKPSVWRAGQ